MMRLAFWKNRTTESDDPRRRVEQLEGELADKLAIVEAAITWYLTYGCRSASRMKMANERLREAVRRYLEE